MGRIKVIFRDKWEKNLVKEIINQFNVSSWKDGNPDAIIIESQDRHTLIRILDMLIYYNIEAYAEGISNMYVTTSGEIEFDSS